MRIHGMVTGESMRSCPDKACAVPCARCNGYGAGLAYRLSDRRCGLSGPLRPDAKIKSEAVNDVWCLDLVFDTTQRGTTVKFLTLLDEYSHYALDIVASHRMGSREVVAALQAAVARHGTPRHLRSDNGGEFIAQHLQTWLRESDIATRFIEPGSPWQNGVNESFNGRFRDECLNRELLASVLEAQCIARNFRDDYNTSRPHSSINYRTPAEYRAELLRQAPDSGQARQAGPSLRLELALSSSPTHNP
jgi:putative transposase